MSTCSSFYVHVFMFMFLCSYLSSCYRSHDPYWNFSELNEEGPPLVLFWNWVKRFPTIFEISRNWVQPLTLLEIKQEWSPLSPSPFEISRSPFSCLHTIVFIFLFSSSCFHVPVFTLLFSSSCFPVHVFMLMFMLLCSWPSLKFLEIKCGSFFLLKFSELRSHTYINSKQSPTSPK